MEDAFAYVAEPSCPRIGTQAPCGALPSAPGNNPDRKPRKLRDRRPSCGGPTPHFCSFLQVMYRWIPTPCQTAYPPHKPAGRASPHNADSAATKCERFTTCKNLQKSSRQLTHSTVLAYESAAALSGAPSKSDLDAATDIPGLTALREVDRLALLSFTEQRGASKQAVDTSSHVSPAAPLVRLHQKSRIPITKELNSSSCRSRYSLSTLRPSTLSRGTLRLGLRLCLSTLRARSPISTR